MFIFLFFLEINIPNQTHIEPSSIAIKPVQAQSNKFKPTQKKISYTSTRRSISHRSLLAGTSLSLREGYDIYKKNFKIIILF